MVRCLFALLQTQWKTNGGRCGICGDPYNAAHPNEAGGIYAKGIIVRTYQRGSIIQVMVYMTVSHKGYFQFRICPNNNPNVEVTQSCLDRNLLRQPNGATKYSYNPGTLGQNTVSLQLPTGMVCTQCVLQWTYNAGKLKILYFKRWAYITIPQYIYKNIRDYKYNINHGATRGVVWI